MTIKATRRQTQPQVFELVHHIYCESSGHCECKLIRRDTRSHDASTGLPAIKPLTIRVPKSVTVASGQASEKLHDCAAFLPQVMLARKQGLIRVSS
jgi:hypothetical protein